MRLLLSSVMFEVICVFHKVRATSWREHETLKPTVSKVVIDYLELTCSSMKFIIIATARLTVTAFDGVSSVARLWMEPSILCCSM